MEDRINMLKEETERFRQCEPFLKQTITVTGKFQKYSTKDGCG